MWAQSVDPRQGEWERFSKLNGLPTDRPLLSDSVEQTANGTLAGEPSTPDDLSVGPQGALIASAAILALVAVVYALYAGADLALPVAMAAVLNLLLRPLTDFLRTRVLLPLPLAAFVVLLAAFGLVLAVAYALSLASSSWATRIPEMFDALRQKLAYLSGALSTAQDALRRVENLQMAPDTPGAAVAVAQNSALPGLILFGTASAIRQFLTTMLILFFMLATGDRLLRALIEVLPTFRDKRKAVEIASEIQSNVARYQPKRHAQPGGDAIAAD